MSTHAHVNFLAEVHGQPALCRLTMARDGAFNCRVLSFEESFTVVGTYAIERSVLTFRSLGRGVVTVHADADGLHARSSKPNAFVFTQFI